MKMHVFKRVPEGADQQVQGIRCWHGRVLSYLVAPSAAAVFLSCQD